MSIQKKILIILILSSTLIFFAGSILLVAKRSSDELERSLISISEVQLILSERSILRDEYFLFPGERAYIQWISLNNLIESKLSGLENDDLTVIKNKLIENNNRIKSMFNTIVAIETDGVLDGADKVEFTSELRKQITLLEFAITKQVDTLLQIMRTEVKDARLSLDFYIIATILSLYLLLLLIISWFYKTIFVLATLQSKNKATLASIGDGLLVTDLEGRIDFVNASFEKMLGWKLSEVKNKPASDVLIKENESGDRVDFKDFLLSRALGKSKEETELHDTYWFVRHDGTRFPASVIVTPITLHGKVIGAVEVLRDITKETEVDRAKSEFVSLASHQLRTPLSAINWYAEMLENGDAGPLNKDQHSFLKQIYDGSQRMVGMVNALLNVSRIDLDKLSLDPEPTDLIMLAKRIVAEVKPAADKSGLDLSENYDINMPIVNTDPKLTGIIFQNFLTNAIKYTQKGEVKLFVSLHNRGEVVEGVKVKKKSYSIIVKDTGIGIPKHQQNKIFTKMFRADNARQVDQDGSGLGLYIVKKIAALSAGKVWYNTEINKGSTFCALIPIDGMKQKNGTVSLSE